MFPQIKAIAGITLSIAAVATAGQSNATHALAVPPPAGLPLRILPLGDSITFGYGEASGNSYRRNLQCLLHNFGFPTQLIGSIKNGDWANNASDGFVLHTIAQIQEAAAPEVNGSSGPLPNVVLVHAGTVDLDYDVDVATAPARLQTLVQDLADKLPQALIVVSELIVNANSTVQDRIVAYNRQVPGVVKAVRRRAGDRIVRTRMPDVQVRDLLSDGTHPDEVGYSKMARHWLQSVVGAYAGGVICPAVGKFDDMGASSDASNCGLVAH